MSKRSWSKWISVSAAILAAALFAFGSGASASAQDGKMAISQKSVDDAKADLKKLGPEPKAFVLISKIVLPSVVTVVTKHKEKVAQIPDMFGDDWPFDVPNPFPRNRRGRAAPEQDVFGMGSGFVVDKAGHILTNNHVVAGAVEIKVRLADDTQYDATLVGTDENTDLAVIQLKDCPAEKIVPVTVGDSGKLEVGDWVLAVGAPFGFTKSVSAGIVSAVGRQGLMPHGDRDRKIYYENFIQTDAAINRGNSGGPLVNYSGEVIGINAAIETPSGASAGVGFAIPTSLARPVMEQLIAKGKVTRGYLGVTIRETTDDDVKKLKLEKREGIYVEEVKPGTPAMDAGLESKDVIVKVNGKPAESVIELQSTIAATEPGKKVTMEVLRDGKPKTVEVTIKELPSEFPTTEASYADPDLGIKVRTLTSDLAQQAQAYVGDKGVLVMEVIKDSPADRAGIKYKDLIKEVANKPISSAGDFEAARAKVPLDKGVLLLVKTGDNNARLVLVMVK